MPMAVELCDILQLPRFFTAEVLSENFQKSFLRPPYTERDQCAFPQAAQSMSRDAFHDWCCRWGYFDEIRPRKGIENYDVIVIYALGVEGMYNMMKYLQGLLSPFEEREKGASPNIPKIFLLTGSRPLTMKGEDAMAQWLRERNLPDTEEWAVRVLFRNFLEPLGVLCEIVNVPMCHGYDAEGELRWKRPNTRDTLRAFFKRSNRVWTSLLAISVNPFVSYQHAVGTAVWLEQEGCDKFASKTLETVGPLHSRFYSSQWSQNEELLIAILLDNVARCAYEEFGILKTKGCVSC